MIKILKEQLKNKSKRRIVKELGIDMSTLNSILDGKNKKDKYKKIIENTYFKKDVILVDNDNLKNFLTQNFEVEKKEFNFDKKVWEIYIKYLEN